MAKISIQEMKKQEKNNPKVHTNAFSSYSTFKINDKLYMQIDTYGTSSRKIKGSVSQSIQLDKENAIELIHILKDIFKI